MHKSKAGVLESEQNRIWSCRVSTEKKKRKKKGMHTNAYVHDKTDRWFQGASIS